MAIRKKFLLVLVILSVLFGVFALTACGDKNYTVTFMVQNDETGEWEQYGGAESVTDGKATVLEAPEKEGYVFRNWYETKAFDEGTEFKNENIEENKTVYAFYVTKKIAVSVNGADAVEKDLKDIKKWTVDFEKEAEEKELTFDGWYTDADYTEEYQSKVDTTTVYGRYVAEIIFDNGYEIVYKTSITPGESIKKPSSENYLKYYMDDEDIYFVDASKEYLVDNNYVEFDFSSIIEKNTVITVLWKTPFLNFNVLDNGNLYTDGFNRSAEGYDVEVTKSFPVLSLPYIVTVDDEKEYCDVVINNSALTFSPNEGIEKIIFGKGIKQIKEFNHFNNVTEMSIPETVKVIDHSFNEMLAIKEINLPEGVETIVLCFWSDIMSYEQYDFDIEIPDSVTCLSAVPTNLSFSDESVFYNDNDKRIYKIDGEDKILVSDLNVNNGELHVEEGVTAIQTGAFSSYYPANYTFAEAFGLKYLYLPASFKSVSYNADVADYEFYYSGNKILNFLYDATKASSPKNKISPVAYSICNELDIIENMVVDAKEMPEGINAYAFVSTTNKTYTSSAMKNKIKFVANVPEGESVSVVITATNRTTMESQNYNIDATSGSLINEQQVLEAAGLKDSEIFTNFQYLQFGEAFDFSEKIKGNKYITLNYEYKAAGFDYEIVDGAAVVTKYNQNNAYKNENTGFYFAVIPEIIENCPVTKIAENAFSGAEALEKIYIPATIKEIGNKAFYNTKNLTYVSIAQGGLEIIGESAFENSGFTTISIPLSNLKEIKPYAFKSSKLEKFTAVKGEEDKFLLTYQNKVYSDMKIGEFYFVQDFNYGVLYGIVKLMSAGTEQIAATEGSETMVDVTVYDVQYVATAGGYAKLLNIGWSARNYNPVFANTSGVLRFEVMEGSIYYMNNSNGITFGLVSKIHKNAFTDMNEKFEKITLKGDTKTSILYAYKGTKYVYDCWLSIEDVVSANPSIFEEGWYNGYDLESDEYKNLKECMALATQKTELA